MIEQLAWHAQAACRDVASEGQLNIFWGASREWQAYCAECPVSWSCLHYAIDNNEKEGVFGGMAPERRSEFLRKHANPTSPAAARDHLNDMKRLRRLIANDDRSVGVRARG